jgi:putative DNA primase/helicase
MSNYPAPYEKVFTRLEDNKLRQSESGVWTCRCPAHDDRTPSMTLRVGDTGCLLLKCHRNNGDGCTLGDILAAIDCTTADIFPGRKRDERVRKTDVYSYRDEGGNTLFQAVRTYDAEGKKRMSQRRPNPAKADDPDAEPFIYSLSGVRRVLYRLPELLAEERLAKKEKRAPKVYIVEGEPCVEAMAWLGFVATTNPGGAGKFHLCDHSPLLGWDVVVLPDNDARDEKLFREQGRESWAGQGHAEQVCKTLYSTANSVRYVDLPGSPIKGDIADWVAARSASGFSREEMRKEFLSVVARVPVWVPPGQPHPFFAAAESASRHENASGLKEWKRSVEDAAMDFSGAGDPDELSRLAVRLGALLLAGSETFLGMRRPERSLPIEETKE